MHDRNKSHEACGLLERVHSHLCRKEQAWGWWWKERAPLLALKTEFPRLVLRLRLDTPSHTANAHPYAGDHVTSEPV